MSIYAKPEEKISREEEAGRLLDEETKHLKNRGGTRNPARDSRSLIHLGTFCIIIGGFFFWLWDSIEFSVRRQTAIDAYNYLASRNETDVSTSLYNSFFFDGSDQVQLKAHLLDSSTNMFSSTDQARSAAKDCLDFAERVRCLRTGKIENLDTFATMRYYLFYKWGFDAPIPIRFLNVKIHSADWFPPPKQKDPNDPYSNI